LIGVQKPARFVPGGFCAFMKQLIKTYLEWKASYAPRAAINYRIWLDRFIEVCDEKKINEYTITDVVVFRKWLENRYNPYSIQFATTVIKNFFQFYKMQNYRCLNPMLIKLPRIVAKSHRAVTEAEFEAIVRQIPTDEIKALRDHVMIHLLWDTGMRVSELTDLDISGMDENKKSTTIQTKKTGHKRTIVWSDRTHLLLIKYMTMLKKECQKTGSTALFVGWRPGRGWSKRITARTVERHLKKYVEKAGIIEKVTPHSFRHGWAHKRRDQNAPLAFIQRGLGHMNPVSTFIYQQYDDKEFEKSAKGYLQSS
jgi:integrase/recombinase XerD